MSSTQGRYDVACVAGDTWSGATITITVNGDPMDLAAASIRAQVRSTRSSPVAQEFSTEGGGILITDPAAGEFSILPAVILAAPGAYLWDIEITSGATVKTYVTGAFRVTEDATHG